MGPKAQFEVMWSDRDVAAFLRVSPSTVRRIATKGPGKLGGIDLRLAEPQYIGTMRRWERSRVYRLVGVGQ